MIHTVKGFSVVNETEVDIFLEFTCFALQGNKQYVCVLLNYFIVFLICIFLVTCAVGYLFLFIFVNYISSDFACGSVDKESACNEGDLGLIPGLGRSPGEGKGYPFQYSGEFIYIVHTVHIVYTVHGILQVRILEWVAFPFSRGSSQPRDQTQVSCNAGRLFTS